MKKKMHFTIMGLVVAVLALALALTGCAKGRECEHARSRESRDSNVGRHSLEG